MAKKKHKGNISGLCNQPKQHSHVKEASIDTAETLGTTPIPGPSVIAPGATVHQPDQVDSDDEDIDWNPFVRPESGKPAWDMPDLAPDDEEEPESEPEMSDTECENSDVENEVIEAGDEHWRGDGLHVNMMVMAIENGNDPQDEDWIPESIRKKHQARLARGMENAIRLIIDNTDLTLFLVKPRPTTYQKGPDVGSKSERT